MNTPTFKLILADPNLGLCQAWEDEFESFSDVTIHHGRFEDTSFDCVVSPANSFGLMDGGVDEAITMYFGQQMMDRVQSEVIRQYAGEQPVGTSMIVHGNSEEEIMDERRIRWVAHTPTMMIPMDIGHTTNVYMAFKAMLLAIEKHNEHMVDIESESTCIRTVVCPGMGTGTGRMPYNRAASAMREAYQNVYNPPTEITWEFATTRYGNIRNSHNI